MDNKMALESMECIIDAMPKESRVGRLQLFFIIRSIVNELQRQAKESNLWNAYMSEKFNAIIWSTEAISGLNDGNGHPAEQHASWARIAINTLKSGSCFGREQ